MKKLSILFIANSFADDTIEYMPRIAKDFGYDLDVFNLYIGGCSVEIHIDNLINHKHAYELRTFNKEKDIWETTLDVASNDFVASRNWDYIVLQQNSYMSGQKDGLKNVNKLVELVKKIANKDVKFAWNMTWAYPKDSDLDVFESEYQKDQQKMFNCILKNVENNIKNNPNFEVIIPNLISLQNARKYYDERVLHRDGFHLSYQPGRYLAGLTAIAAILKVDISKVKYNPDTTKINKQMKNAFVKCVQDSSNFV